LVGCLCHRSSKTGFQWLRIGRGHSILLGVVYTGIVFLEKVTKYSCIQL